MKLILKFFSTACVIFCAGCLTAADTDTLVFVRDGQNSSGQPIKQLMHIQSDGSGLGAFDIRTRNHPSIFHPGMKNYDPVANDGKSIYELAQVNWQNVREVCTPSVSPVGKKLLFRNCWTIHEANWDGTGYVNVIPYKREWYTPSWSKDGKMLATATDISSNAEIYVMNYDGGGKRNLTQAPNSSELSPSWSPDSKEIAFISNRNGSFELFAIDLSGDKVRKILGMTEGDIREPVWGMNGKIIFAVQKKDGSSNLYQVDSDGKNLKQLTSGAFWDGQPSVNFDGSLVAFASNRSGKTNIWILSLKDGAMRNLTNNASGGEHWPCWVPRQISDNPFKVETANIAGIVLPRPRMMFHAEDIPALKQKFQTGVYQKPWKGLLAECDALLKDDSKQYKAVKDSIANAGRRAPGFNAAYKLAFAYQITGKKAYGERAAKLITEGVKAVALNYPGTTIASGNPQLACAFDWAYPCFTNADRVQTVKLLNYFVKTYADYCNNYFFASAYMKDCASNFATYATQGGSLALAMNGEEGFDDEWLNTFLKIVRLNTANWLDCNGGCGEGFSYFIMPTKAMLPFLCCLKVNGLDKQYISPNLKKFGQWMAVCNINGYLPNIGDCDQMAVQFSDAFNVIYPDDPVVKSLWNSRPRANTPAADPFSLLWFTPSTATHQNYASLPGAMYFPSSNLSVMRSDFSPAPVFLTFMTSGGGHSHHECGAVTLYGYGRPMIVDPGQAVPHADHHSQMLVNGYGRKPNYPVPGKKTKAKINMLKTSDFAYGVAASMPDAFANSVYNHTDPDYALPGSGLHLDRGNRIAVMIRPDDKLGIPACFVVSDQAQADGKPTLYEEIFITDPDFKPVPKKDGALLFSETINDVYFESHDRKKRGGNYECSFNIPAEGDYDLWIQTRGDSFTASCRIDGKQVAGRVGGRVTRSHCWQWCKVGKMKLSKGEHKLRGNCEAVNAGFAWLPAGTDFSGWGEPPENAIRISPKSYKITNDQRWVRHDAASDPNVPRLLIAPLTDSKLETVTEPISFRTRFYGQILIQLNRTRMKKTAVDSNIAYLLFPHKASMALPEIVRGSNTAEIRWKKAVDKIEWTIDSLTVKRFVNGKQVAEFRYEMPSRKNEK